MIEFVLSIELNLNNICSSELGRHPTHTYTITMRKREFAHHPLHYCVLYILIRVHCSNIIPLEKFAIAKSIGFERIAMHIALTI